MSLTEQGHTASGVDRVGAIIEKCDGVREADGKMSSGQIPVQAVRP